MQKKAGVPLLLSSGVAWNSGCRRQNAEKGAVATLRAAFCPALEGPKSVARGVNPWEEGGSVVFPAPAGRQRDKKSAGLRSPGLPPWANDFDPSGVG